MNSAIKLGPIYNPFQNVFKMFTAKNTDLEKQRVFKCHRCESGWQDYDAKYELDDGRIFCSDCRYELRSCTYCEVQDLEKNMVGYDLGDEDIWMCKKCSNRGSSEEFEGDRHYDIMIDELLD